MNIWAVNPYLPVNEAVGVFEDWREFAMWSDVVTGRRFAQLMGLPMDVRDADLHLESHQDLIAAASTPRTIQLPTTERLTPRNKSGTKASMRR